MKPRVGLIFDERCQQHAANYNHPESSARTSAAWTALESAGLVAQCTTIDGQLATVSQLSVTHGKEYIQMIENTENYPFGSDEEDSEEDMMETVVNSETIRVRPKYPHCIFLDRSGDVFICKHTSVAAKAAVGSLIALCDAVVNGVTGGALDSGFAIIRPPGHHAFRSKASGFCLYNNVVVAADYLLSIPVLANNGPLSSSRRRVQRVAIVDWDVHHGNGTQGLVEGREDILFISIHRYEDGSFYPESGSASDISLIDKSSNSNNNNKRNNIVNIPLPSKGYGDDAYVVIFKEVVCPMLVEYDPDVILVSAGFDAALGDPMGGMCVTPTGFGLLTQLLLGVCHRQGLLDSRSPSAESIIKRKLILSLEGGYSPSAVGECVSCCVSALLGLEMPAVIGTPEIEIKGPDNCEFLAMLEEVKEVQRPYWEFMR